MASVAELQKAFSKDYGDGVMVQSDAVMSCERVPTGVFAVDLSTGGGLPKGKVSIIYGVESSGKTNLMLKAIANHQRLWEDEVCVFVDMENSFDPDWASQLGVDVEALQLVSPEYAEQAVDMIEALLCADNIGFVGLDSVAAMVTINEGASSAEKAVVGGNALVVGKMTRKVVKALKNARSEGRSPTFVAINQIRYKIGVMFGDPETMSGGKALLFASNLTLRCYGKGIVDKKVNPNVPCRKASSVIIKKHKLPITATHCEYEMAMIPHNGLQVGECADKNTIIAYLKDYGWVGKTASGKSWQLFGEEYPTLTACAEKVYESPESLDAVRDKIIARAIAEANGGIE